MCNDCKRIQFKINVPVSKRLFVIFLICFHVCPVSVQFLSSFSSHYGGLIIPGEVSVSVSHFCCPVQSVDVVLSPLSCL